MSYNVVTKERIYAVNGVLKRCDGDYKTSATDVRWIKFDCNSIKMDFVYEQNAKVSDLVKKNGADYGINFPFFYNGQPLGNTEEHDVVITSAYGKMLKWHDFASVNGKPVIGLLNVNDKQDMLVSAAPLLIEPIDGVPNPCYDYYRNLEEVPDDIGKSRAQRTFVALDSRGDLIVAVSDGRTSYDRGLTLEEMTLFMQSKDAVWALNGDGGSSSVLADKNGSLGQNQGVNEKAVHHAVLFSIVSNPIIQSTVNVQINGEQIQSGFLINGTTYAPIKAVAEVLGATVEFDSKTQTVNIINH